MSRFKTVCKRFWPLLTFGVLLLALAVGLLVWHFHSTPERAVEGFLRASLEQDADGLLRYASDYQLTVLKGNTEMDLDDLREMLRRSYEQAEAFRETGRIRFQSEVGEPVGLRRIARGIRLQGGPDGGRILRPRDRPLLYRRQAQPDVLRLRRPLRRKMVLRI